MAALNAILRHVRRSTPAVATERPDADLVARYVRTRDEGAFRELLRRHGPLVWGVCSRLLRDRHAAEDAFQATFLVLARRAASIRRPGAVGSWLYGVARRVAGKLRRPASSVAGVIDPGRGSEEAAAGLTEASYSGQADAAPSPLDRVTGREILELLDEELGRLPERLRAPLVLCYLDGRTRDEAAKALGWSLDKVKRRLEQGRTGLRVRLERRGVSLPAALVTAALAGATAEGAMPTALARATAQAAAAFAAETPTATGPATIALSVMKGMTMARIKWSVTACLLVGVAMAGMGLALGTASADMPPAAASPEKPATPGSVRVVVLDPQGKPLPGAHIHVSVWTNEKDFKANRDFTTDAAGAAQAELPRTFHILRLWASKKPFVTMFANWEQNELASGKGFPAEYTMRLEAGVTAGGRIVDEQGKPIAGAKVQVSLSGDPKPAHSDGRTRYDSWLASGNDTTNTGYGAVTTDADGKWRIVNAPDHPQSELSLFVSHSDYVSDDHWQQGQKAAGVTTAMLRQETATLTLKGGVIVTGQVTDPGGRPIKDAIVIHGDDPYSGRMTSKFPTDADGRFRLPALAPGDRTLTVMAAGFAPQLRKVNLRAGLPPQDFRMAPGQAIRMRVVDTAGNAVSKASIYIMEWKGSESIQTMHNPNHPKVPDVKIPRQTDSNGGWEWTAAPDEPVKLQVTAKGFGSSEVEIAGGASLRTVTLKSEHRIAGRVIDAATGQPIPGFTLVPINIFRKDWFSADRGHAKSGKGGRLDYLATRTDIPLRLRIEAAGYRSQTGPEFRVGDDSSRTQDFRLEPSKPIAGTILGPEGRPAVKAVVVLATPTDVPHYSTDFASESSAHRTFTDAAGRFTFPDPGEPMIVLAQSDAGFARAEFPAGQHDAGTLRLRQWASVRGQLRDGGQPVRGATVFVRPIGIDGLDRPRIQVDTQTVSGHDGRFEFLRVPPGPVGVAVYLGPWQDEGFRSAPHVPLDLKPGEKVELDLGGAGATVTGKVKLTGKVPADLDCTYSLNHLVRREPGVAPPSEIAKLGFDIRKGWSDTWMKSVEGQAYVSTLRTWFVKLAPDGGFRISGVPPGEYDLAVAVYAKPSGCLTDPLANKVVRVTVTAADATRGELAVPEIAAEVVPVPEVGDVPALAFHRADGTNGTLAENRGKFTLVHFWASWCGPCKKQLPAVRQLHDRFAAKGLATLGLSLDEDQSAWQAALKHLDLPGSQGRLAANGAAGVSSVPAYWLLDPEGKIVAKVYDPDELAAALAERLK